MSVAVFVDSSSCITPELADRFNLRLVPLHLLWDGKEYADWVDMTPKEFHARLKTAKTLPTTSGSVQGEFYNAIEEFRGKVDSIVIVTLSPNTPSAGYQSALIAKDMANGITVEVVDSNSNATGLGLVATAAARAASAGANLEQVVQAAKSVIPKTNVFINPGSISYFVRLGRVAKSDIASTEESHIITISKEGKIAPFEKYATREEARCRLWNLVNEKVRKDTPLHVGLFHFVALDEAEDFKKWIASQYNCAELWIGELPPAPAIHVSPESLGIAFYNE